MLTAKVLFQNLSIRSVPSTTKLISWKNHRQTIAFKRPITTTINVVKPFKLVRGFTSESNQQGMIF